MCRASQAQIKGRLPPPGPLKGHFLALAQMQVYSVSVQVFLQGFSKHNLHTSFGLAIDAAFEGEYDL